MEPVIPDLKALARGSLIGLDPGHRKGLTAITVVAGLSLVTSTALFIHLTCKLLRWHIRYRQRRKTEERARLSAHSPGVDLTLGLAPRHFQRRGMVAAEDAGDSRSGGGPRLAASRIPGNNRIKQDKPPSREPNQFVVLLYNLLLADIHQSMAFFLNAVWVARDGIFVGTTTCWAQGWFVSTGDLAASLFILAIAIHTWVVAIKGWKPPQCAIILTCVLIWVFDYAMVVVGYAASTGFSSRGGFYVRAVAWCWVNDAFENVRLLTHYLFIFIALFSTSAIYTAIFLYLRRRKSVALRASSSNHVDCQATSIETWDGALSYHHHSNSNSNSNSIHKHSDRNSQQPPTDSMHSGYNSAFLIYPVIYVICTCPLAIGRIVTMAGGNAGVPYFCLAGGLISLNGFLDTVLWSSTRRQVVFGDVDESDALGLDTFTFMRTPHGRKYGNMIWVEGAGRSREVAAPGEDGAVKSRQWFSPARLWEGFLSGAKGVSSPSATSGGGAGGGGGKSRGRDGWNRTERTISQESLQGMTRKGENMGGIQMDLVTTVVVEVDPDSKNGRVRDGGLVVSPEDYIREMEAAGSASEGGVGRKRGGTARDPSSSRCSVSGSEKELNLNVDILNRLP